MIKRYFRIAPLFYVMIVFELGRQAFSGQIQQDAASILLNLSLFFGLIPYSTTSSFVWGGWSIGVEMVFYLVFPVFVLAARSRLAVALFVLMGIIISCSSRVELDEIFRQIEKLPSEWDKETSYFAFSTNIVFFTFGLCAYHFSKTIEKTSVWARYVLPGLTCVIIGGLLFTNVGTYFKGWGRMDLVFWGMGFGMLCLWQHANPGKIISGRLFNYVGERSFSIYLIHPVIVYLLKDFWVKIYEYFHVYLREYSFFVMAAAVLVVVMIVSEITYRFIEVPGVRMGKRLCARVA